MTAACITDHSMEIERGNSFSLHSMGGSLSNIAPPQHLPLPSSSSSSSSFTGSSRLRNFLQENKLKGKIVSSTDTDLICDAVTVKSLIWQVKAGPCICLVLSIDDKVDHNLVAQAVSTLPSFAVSPITRKDVTLAGHDTAREESGYDIGTIPPVGHTKQMPIFMDLSLVNRLKDYGKYFCGGGGEVGYELLISLNQLLKLDYMCIKPISKNFQDNFDYYVLLDETGKVLKSSFKEKYLKVPDVENSGNGYCIEKRRYQKSDPQQQKLERKPQEQSDKQTKSNSESFEDVVGEDILDSGRTILQNFLQVHDIKASIVPSFSELLLDAIFIKSLVFHVRPTDACVVIVLLAEDRVESSLVAAALASYGAKSRTDVNLASRSMAIEATGYPLGCVPPIAHRKNMPVLVDRNLVDKMKDLDNSDLDMFLSAGGGEVGYDLMIPLHELLKLPFVSVAPLADQSPMKRKAIETRIVKALKTKSKPNSADPSKPPSLSQFRRAAMADDSECLAVMIDQINNKGMIKEMADLPSAEGGKTALHLAAWRGNITSVQMLLDHGANIDLVSTGLGNYGKSPIFYAITRCRDNVVNLLLERGANISIVNNKGQSPRSLGVSHLPESTQLKIMQQEEKDLLKWTNYRETHSDNITYGDLDSRFLDEYIDLKTGNTIKVDRYGEFRCIEPSSFESRWRGNFTHIARNKQQHKLDDLSSNITSDSKPCQHSVPCNCRPDHYTYGPLPPPATDQKNKPVGSKDEQIKEDDYISMRDVSMVFAKSEEGEEKEEKEEIKEEKYEIPIIVVGDEGSMSMFKNSLQQLLLSTSYSPSSYVGLDCEWKPYEGETYNKVAVLQIALPTVVFLCDQQLYPTECTSLLIDILEASHIIKLGFSLRSDLERLFASYLLASPSKSSIEVSVKNVIDLVDVSQLVPENLMQTCLGVEAVKRNKKNGKKKNQQRNSLSLSRLSQIVLGKKLDKRMQCSAWHERPLSKEQIVYAALDAGVLCAMFKSIQCGYNGWILDQTWIKDQCNHTFVYSLRKVAEDLYKCENGESQKQQQQQQQQRQRLKSLWIFRNDENSATQDLVKSTVAEVVSKECDTDVLIGKSSDAIMDTTCIEALVSKI